MKLVLGTFARGGIEAFSGRDLPAGVQMALRHYAKRRSAAGHSTATKSLDRRPLRTLTPAASGIGLELSVDAETREALERRAREYGGMTVEELAEHAVLVYLAECDAQLTESSG